MTDDIETLREYILYVKECCETPLNNKEARAALERVKDERDQLESSSNIYMNRSEKLEDALEKIERERDALRAKLADAIAELRSKDPNFTPIFDSYANENQRFFDEIELLRAKLEKAKEALEGVIRVADRNTIEFDAARTVLAEFSDGAPAQPPQNKDETPAEMLNRLGDDASKWAAEFNITAQRLGYQPMDEGWLIGWFANAIEHSWQLRHWKREAQLPQISDEAGPIVVGYISEDNGQGMGRGTHCTKLECRDAGPLEKRGLYWTCPKCRASYGE